MKSEVKRMCEASILFALGILLPLAFHGIANAGSVFLPMHLPVLLCGFICGPFYGAMIGLLTPLFSSLWTGMPPIAYLPGMMCELFAYGLFSGLFFRMIKTGHFVWDVYLSLIIALLLGRAVGGLVNVGIYFGKGSDYTWSIFVNTYFLLSWPGLLIQLLAVPSVLVALEKSHLYSSYDRQLFWPQKPDRDVREQAAFFDRLASDWDAHREIADDKIVTLLDACHFVSGMQVLDVACGTGIIDHDLAKKGLEVTAIDVSAKMIEIAIKKNSDEKVVFLCRDFYAFLSPKKFDALIVFDAYPHFLDQTAFAVKAASLLKKGGSLFIVHAGSKEQINAHHSEHAESISRELRNPKKEAAALRPYFKMITGEDEKDHYFIELKRR